MLAGKPEMPEGGAVRARLVSRHRLRREFQHPAAHRLVRDIEPALGEKLLDIAVAQGEPEIQPDGVLDDDRGKAMAAVRDIGHARGYRRLPFPTSSLS